MEIPLGTIVKGDALEVLRTWPAESVQCCVTSPPYWGLRDYGEPGQGGLEATPEDHVAWIVEVMREVRRVLRKDGTLWINYGDCYASDTKGAGGSTVKQSTNKGSFHSGGWKCDHGLKPKDLVGMPWRVAFALRADGWWLRCDIVWAKPNPMPESVTDRPTRAHEYVFLLTKAARYFYDAEAVREPYMPATLADRRDNSDGARRERQFPGDPSNGGTLLGGQRAAGRNLRSVWTIPTQPYPGAHFATFPEALVRPCILAGTSERGACPACGAPWVRVVDAAHVGDQSKLRKTYQQHGVLNRRIHPGAHNPADRSTTGWRPTCSCHPADPVPCVVLDPFAGSGTTGIVAYKLGREFVGIDLAGGDKDLGGHTAHDRLAAAREGRDTAEHVALQRMGQQTMEFTP